MLVDLTDQPMGSERASVKQRMNLQWSEGGGVCAICSTGSVSCSAQYSWSLVPPLFRLGGSVSMCLRNTRQATTRSPGSPSDPYRRGLSWCQIRKSEVRLRIFRKRDLSASEKVYGGTLAMRFLWP